MSQSTLDVGKKLVELAGQNKNVDAVDQLYAPNAVSVEATSHGAMPRTMEGIDAIRKKNQWWLDNHEIHKNEVSGPFPHDDRFIVNYKLDVTSKSGQMAGQRMQLEESALYTVKDGKIVREEFFYSM